MHNIHLQFTRKESKLNIVFRFDSISKHIPLSVSEWASHWVIDSFIEKIKLCKNQAESINTVSDKLAISQDTLEVEFLEVEFLDV